MLFQLLNRHTQYAPDGAEGGQAADANKGAENGADSKADTGKPADELSKGVDAAVKKALDEREKFWQSKFDQKNTELQRAKAEQDRILKEKMSEQERVAYEREQKEKELTDKEARILASELRLAKVETLVKAGLDPKLETLIGGNTAEEIAQNVQRLTDVIQAEVQKGIQGKLAAGGKPGDGSGTGSAKAINYAEFMAKSATERAAFMAGGGLIKD